MPKVYNAYGDNVMIRKINTINMTSIGEVLHCNDSSLPAGTIVLYQDTEWNEVNLTEDKVVDVVWRPKIRAIVADINKE